MTGIPEADRTETLTDPETLCDRDGVDVREQTHDVDAEEFEDVTDLDSHVAVGTADDRGVLLQNDGHHGWTLLRSPSNRTMTGWRSRAAGSSP